jgi:hypothetical protein
MINIKDSEVQEVTHVQDSSNLAESSIWPPTFLQLCDPSAFFHRRCFMSMEDIENNEKLGLAGLMTLPYPAMDFVQV